MYCAICGHLYEYHGDRAIAACSVPLTLRAHIGCDCPGWQPEEPPC